MVDRWVYLIIYYYLICMSIGFESGIDSQVLDSDAYNLKEKADAIFEPD